jgi:Flp pilus assembly protein TadD
LGRHKEAIEKYERATKLNSKDAHAYASWGVALANLGRHKEAIEKYKRVIELNPKDAVTYTNWGVA